MALCADAYDRKMGSHRRTNIVEEKTGRVFNQSAVSPGSPDWMSSPFESNRVHLEDRGMIPSARGHDTKAQSDAMGKPSTAFGAEPRKRSNIVEEGTGHVFHTSKVSGHSPDWMQQREGEGGRPAADAHSFGKLVPHQTPTAEAVVGNVGPSAHHPTFAQKGSAREPRPGDWSCKKTLITDEETGQLRSQSVISRSAPDFMKSPFESHRPYFERHGIDQKIRPRTARQHGGYDNHAAGKAYAEGADHVWAKQGESHTGHSKKVNVKHEETGEIHANTLVSNQAPDFMHSPFESSRADLEAQEKVPRPSDARGRRKAQAKGFLESSKKIPPKPVSPDVPEWWKSHQEIVPSHEVHASTKAAGSPAAIAYTPGAQDKRPVPPSCGSGSTAASDRSRASGMSRRSASSSHASRRSKGSQRSSAASSYLYGSGSGSGSRASRSASDLSGGSSGYMYGSSQGSGSRAGTQASGSRASDGSYYSYGPGSRTERGSRAAGGGHRGSPAASSATAFKPPARR